MYVHVFLALATYVRQRHAVCLPGLPDGLFSNKNSNWGKFCSALDWKLLIYFMSICNTLRTLGIFHEHLVHSVFIWYIFLVLVSCAKKNLATLRENMIPR
jgi:hypothetical protein